MQQIQSGMTLGNYTILKLTGRGAFSSVYQAVHNDTGIKVALKVVLASSLQEPMQRAMVENEINVFKLIDYPLVVEFYEAFFDKEYFVVALEFVEGGSILSYINKFGKLTEDEARHYFCQLVQTLEYLNSRCRIAHRDLKAENVLIDENHNIRLIDFGFSHIMSNKIPVINGPCGSPAYAPPEVLKNQPFTHLSDVWSAGVFLYGITTGNLPFVDDNIQRLMQKIVYTEPKFNSNVSPELKDLIMKLLRKNPSQRLSLHEIWSHPWIRKYGGIADLPKLANISRLPIRENVVSKMINPLDSQNLEIYVKNFNSTRESVEYKILCRQDNINLIKSYSKWLPSSNLHHNDNGDIPDAENAKTTPKFSRIGKNVSIENPNPNSSPRQMQPMSQNTETTRKPAQSPNDKRAPISIAKENNPVCKSATSLTTSPFRPENIQPRASCIERKFTSRSPAPAEKVIIQEPQVQPPNLNLDAVKPSSGEEPKSSGEMTRQEQLRMLLEKNEKVAKSKTQTNLRLIF